MVGEVRLGLAEVEQRVCDIASEQLGIPRHQVSPDKRIVEDLLMPVLRAGTVADISWNSPPYHNPGTSRYRTRSA